MRAWFGPTIANTGKAPESAPDGMVWIPGGEFSMGAQVEPNANDVGMRATEDSLNHEVKEIFENYPPRSGSAPGLGILRPR